MTALTVLFLLNGGRFALPPIRPICSIRNDSVDHERTGQPERPLGKKSACEMTN
jgi:hypothetical protein